MTTRAERRRGVQVGGGVVLVGEAAQLAVQAEGGPTTASRSVAQENRSRRASAQMRVWHALAETEVGAFEALESRAPETALCILLGLAKAEKLGSFQSGANR